MNLFLLFFIQQVSSKEPIILLDQFSPPLIMSYVFPLVILIFIFLCIGYFIILFILLCCCCKPEEDEKPNLCTIIFFIISSIIMLLSSILHFVGISKIIDNCYYNEYISKILSLNNDFIKSKHVKHFKKIKEHNENILTLNTYFNDSAKSIISKIQNYNSAFINKNEPYRMSFNKIYLNPSTDSCLKKALREMDESRNTIFLEIISFTENYYKLSKCIQKTLDDYNENIISFSDEYLRFHNNYYSKNQQKQKREI